MFLSSGKVFLFGGNMLNVVHGVVLVFLKSSADGNLSHCEVSIPNVCVFKVRQEGFAHKALLLAKWDESQVC